MNSLTEVYLFYDFEVFTQYHSLITQFKLSARNSQIKTLKTYLTRETLKEEEFRALWLNEF